MVSSQRVRLFCLCQSESFGEGNDGNFQKEYILSDWLERGTISVLASPRVFADRISLVSFHRSQNCMGNWITDKRSGGCINECSYDDKGIVSGFAGRRQ